MSDINLNAETLASLLDRIIPADDYPGAAESGAARFIAGLLTSHEAHLAPLYEAGLQGLDLEADHRYGCGFADIDHTEQDAILRDIEAGKLLTRWSVDAPLFFRTVVNHTAEGYYADPGNGANLDAASWKMIGFTGDTDSRSRGAR